MEKFSLVAGVIGSDVPWLDCPAFSALTWSQRSRNKPVCCNDPYGKFTCRRTIKPRTFEPNTPEWQLWGNPVIGTGKDEI